MLSNMNFEVSARVAGIIAAASLLLAAPLMGVARTIAVDGVTTSDLAMLNTLKPEHPRLLATDRDIVELRQRIQTDKLAADWHRKLRERAEKVLDEKPAQWVMSPTRVPKIPWLLEESRLALDRVLLLGLLYRLDGDDRFRIRAEKELRAVCAFPDWNPAHFLDTAEMTAAVGIGYDWFYSKLSRRAREELTSGIINLGLQPGIAGYRNNDRQWVASTHNWNLVCNNGLAIGALAIADEQPEVAAFVLSGAIRAMPRAMAGFAPDGGWIEGPAYWGYGVRFCALGFGAMQTALGTTFRLDDSPGFSEAGIFPAAITGPTGLCFNWGDCGERAVDFPNAAELWLAKRFDRPEFAWRSQECALNRLDPLHLLWKPAIARSPVDAELRIDLLFRGAGVVTMRGDWEGAGASFIAFKGGRNAATHSNLDLGTFVFDADGIRWAMELGADDYLLPGYWEANQRFGYYRCGTIGQNTLMINGANQEHDAAAAIIAFDSATGVASASSDLTHGYRKIARRVERGIQLCGQRRHVMIQDEIACNAPADITWNMHTRTDVEIKGSTALLTTAGKTMVVRVLKPEGAVIEVVSAEQKRPQSRNTGVRRIVVRPKERTTDTLIAVLLSPGTAEPYSPSIKPLASWPGRLEAVPAVRPVSPSAPSPPRQTEFVVDANARGIRVDPGVRGVAISDFETTRGDYVAIAKTLEVAEGTVLRGVAGGLFADRYDWRTRNHEPRPTTLEFLRWTRDRHADLFITVNARGLVRPNPANPARYLYYTSDTAVLKSLAADWVRYVNRIVRRYHQGDPIADSRDAAILASINWSGAVPGEQWDTLPRAGEAPLPLVRYWEIGNEPTVSIRGTGGAVDNGSTTPAEVFYPRYKAIAQAMKAEDPDIKVGPCIVDGSREEKHLNVILSDSSVPVDFISYHPYQKLGDHTTTAAMQWALGSSVASGHRAFHSKLSGLVKASGRNLADIEFVASEVNASHYLYNEKIEEGQMAHALGSVETIFIFAELGLKASHYWLWPADSWTGTEYPVFLAYAKLRDCMGDRLIGSYDDRNLVRAYAMRTGADGPVGIWVLNFQDDCMATVPLTLRSFPKIARATLHTLRNVTGSKAGLFAVNAASHHPGGARNEVGWVESAIATTGLEKLDVAVPAASVSVLYLEPGD
ncbi:MAG: heparinase II/III domain-containing protein [Candidatus Sumerlaeaceae bacterium]